MMTAPTGMKTMPTTLKSKMTSRGVRIGRHALRVCCLNAVSAARDVHFACQPGACKRRMLRPRARTRCPRSRAQASARGV